MSKRVKQKLSAKIQNGKVGSWSLSVYDETGAPIKYKYKYKIRKDVPIPWEVHDINGNGPSKAIRKTLSKYPLERMAPGDSFFIVNRSKGESESYNYRSTIRGVAATLGVCVAIQHRVENGVDGIRVWRWK